MVDDSKAGMTDKIESPSLFSIVFYRTVSLTLEQRKRKNLSDL